MTTSDDIRSLAGEGLSVAEIAKRLGIRYQHAYGVLKQSESPLRRSRAHAVIDNPDASASRRKPPLSVALLLGAGFELSARWKLIENGDLVSDRALPRSVGVYAFGEDERVVYVGVATAGIAKRLSFYGKPGAGQPTNIRINGVIREALEAARSIEIYTATPGDFDWNGLPVHGSAGLELGLIKKFALPWNVRSAN
jgi:hypothetical protein